MVSDSSPDATDGRCHMFEDEGYLWINSRANSLFCDSLQKQTNYSNRFIADAVLNENGRLHIFGQASDIRELSSTVR